MALRTLIGRLFTAPPRRWMSARMWALVAALLLAAQFGLLLHQANHHLRADVVATDECALCSVAAGMTAAPAPPLLLLPVFILLAIMTLPVPVRLRARRVALSFRSRAPPSISA